LQAWRKAYGIPIGESLDALFDHAMRGEGAFIFRLPVNGNALPDNSDKHQ
jgi:hypothetical protein